MDKTEANVIRITRGDLENIVQRKDAVERFNTQLRILREQSLYESLTQGTKIRLDMMNKAKVWMDMLERRIFDPIVIRELDINKVISLMKYVSNVTLRLLAQMNDIEKIFKTYVESSLAASPLMREMEGKQSTDDEQKMKDTLMKVLMESIKTHQDVEDVKIEIDESAKDGKAPDVLMGSLVHDLEDLDIEIDKDILDKESPK